jgi:hypothetical protein
VRALNDVLGYGRDVEMLGKARAHTRERLRFPAPAACFF